MKISSSAFRENESIPARYTCDGEDLIPPLKFEGVPEKSVSLVLIMDDPDAPVGMWDHWIVWNIPPRTGEIAEGKPPQGVVGRNSWGKSAWGGPCPPDKQHRYFFKLYALDAKLDLPNSARKGEVEKAMKGHVVAEAQLIGVYDRKRR